MNNDRTYADDNCLDHPDFLEDKKICSLNIGRYFCKTNKKLAEEIKDLDIRRQDQMRHLIQDCAKVKLKLCSSSDIISIV